MWSLSLWWEFCTFLGCLVFRLLGECVGGRPKPSHSELVCSSSQLGGGLRWGPLRKDSLRSLHPGDFPKMRGFPSHCHHKWLMRCCWESRLPPASSLTLAAGWLCMRTCDQRNTGSSGSVFVWDWFSGFEFKKFFDCDLEEYSSHYSPHTHVYVHNWVRSVTNPYLPLLCAVCSDVLHSVNKRWKHSGVPFHVQLLFEKQWLDLPPPSDLMLRCTLIAFFYGWGRDAYVWSQYPTTS